MKRSGYHIFVAVPTRGSIRWETITLLSQIRDNTPGLRPILFQPGNLSVALTRNIIVRQFLNTDCTTLVMVDDDIVPPPQSINCLDEFIPEYAMVSVPHMHPFPGQPDNLVLSAYTMTDEGITTAPLYEGINEVDAVATGCVAISREALTALGPDPFRIETNPTAKPAVSDDLLFCQDLRTLGFKIGCWVDGWPCDHVTTVMLGPLWENQKQKVGKQ